MLLEEGCTEDKLAGVLFLQEILLPAGALDCRFDLLRFACLFDQGKRIANGVITKNVAPTPKRCSASKTLGVQIGSGPSSKVKKI